MRGRYSPMSNGGSTSSRSPRRGYYNTLCVVLSFSLACYLLSMIRMSMRERAQRQPTIFLVTVTQKHMERMPDMIRFSQTLMHVKDVVWILVEHGEFLNPAVARIAMRSGHPVHYLPGPEIPRGNETYGWHQRNIGLAYLREHYKRHGPGGVVYFADTTYSYDVRVFDEYIRAVKRIGVWAVGFGSGSFVEAPIVENDTIVGWLATEKPNQKIAVDMCGFAVNFNEILRVNASFHLGCVGKAPEECFIRQFGLRRDQIEPFGHKGDPKEVYVWHTDSWSHGGRGEFHGYELERDENATEVALKEKELGF